MQDIINLFQAKKIIAELVLADTTKMKQEKRVASLAEIVHSKMEQANQVASLVQMQVQAETGQEIQLDNADVMLLQ